MDDPLKTLSRPELEKLVAAATEFTFYPDGADPDSQDTHLFSVRVAHRGRRHFAIVRMGECWDGERWDYEHLPSNRTEEFKAATRFPLEKALQMAADLVNATKVNGMTHSEWAALRAEREARQS